MRINDELNKMLLQLENENGDNVLSLLDVAFALEKTYKQIDDSILKTEKDFTMHSDKYICKKVGYNAVDGKTIYSVSDNNSTEVLFNIKVSNIGEISFDVIGQNQEEIKKIIEKFNEASNNLLESIKLNADVSFFTENREITLSTKPYLALKMGKFMEEDKAVLVYCSEQNTDEINKTSMGIKYIRLDQIEEYVKNIKLDERKIPILTYAFLNNCNESDFIDEKESIMNKTYPKMTIEKAKCLKEPEYLNDVQATNIPRSVIGTIGLGGLGLIIGSTTILPTLPLIIGGVTIPAAIGISIYCKEKSNIKKAIKKEFLLNEAHKEIYVLLKTLANKKVAQIEKEIALKYRKKQKTISPTENFSIKETLVEAKKMLKATSTKNSFLYLPVINQIENAYGLNESLIVDENLKKDEILYGELLQVLDEICELPSTDFKDSVKNSINAMHRLIKYGDGNKTIENCNDYYHEIRGKLCYLSTDNQAKSIKDIINIYFETMLTAKEKNNPLSVQAILSIPDSMRNNLIRKIKDFASCIYHVGDDEKKSSAEFMLRECNRTIENEIIILNLINEIYDKNLSYDLLGKNIKKELIKVKKQDKK